MAIRTYCCKLVEIGNKNNCLYCGGVSLMDRGGRVNYSNSRVKSKLTSCTKSWQYLL